MSRRRPALWQSAIVFVLANYTAAAYATGHADGMWLGFWTLFLAMELGAAFSAEDGDTFSERWWAWTGVKPLRPGRWHRAVTAPVFLAVLGGHLFLGSSHWWTSGAAIGVTAVAPGGVVVSWGWRTAWAWWHLRHTEHVSMGMNAPQWCATCSEGIRLIAEWVPWPCEHARRAAQRRARWSDVKAWVSGRRAAALARAETSEGLTMKQRLMEFAARWFLGGLFRDIAEGKRFAWLTPWYWKAIGVKTTTGAVLGLLFAALAAFDPGLAKQVAAPALTIIGIVVTLGLVDTGWRTETLPPEWLAALAKIMSAGPALSAVVALLAEWLPSVPGCGWCTPLATKIQLAAAAVAGATAWVAARYHAEPPMRPFDLARNRPIVR